jgi:putative ABC transport system ATP-binding protein
MTSVASTRIPGVICRDVTKDYGEGSATIHALRGVTVDVYPGELTLLVGPSGCGKSTLISILAATLNATSGHVEVLGTSLDTLKRNTSADFRAQNVGFVFQQFNLLPSLTAGENVAIPLVIQGNSKSAAMTRAAEVLAEVGMGDRLDSLPRQMSGGQQQRVAIARALVHKPRLLVCDEPTSAVDARTGQTVMTLIRELALDTNRVTIVVTHDLRVYGFADRIISMEDGRISGDKRVQPTELSQGRQSLPEENH